MSRIAILDDYQGVALSLGPWDRLGATVTVFRETLADPVAELAGYDTIVCMRERTPFPRALLEALPALRLLVTTGARNRAIDLVAAAERGVTVCGTPHFGTPTVDLTWGLILAVLRGIPDQQAALRAGRWQTALGRGVEGRTLALLGLGNLGTRVARIGAAFGMRCIAWSSNLTADRAAAAGATLVDKPTLFAEADVLSVHLVLSERSRGIVGAADLARMQPEAVLINTSRGPLVDTAALVAALREGRLGGAGIDVFDVEPLPHDHPLLDAPNTVLTPHLGYVTEENYRAYFAGAVEAIEAFRAGTPIRVCQ